MAEEEQAEGGGIESFACVNRPLPAAVLLMEWCPVVDLLAMVCVDETLVLYRYMKWQRVWSIHYDRPIVCLAWKPDDGKILCAGDEDGIVRLYDAELGVVLFTAPALSASIASLCWTREIISQATSSTNSGYSTSLSTFVPPLPPPSSEVDGSFERRTQVTMGGAGKSAVLDILTSIDKSGNVVLSVYASFIAAQISLAEMLKTHNVPAARATRVSLSSDLRLLSVVMESPDAGAAALLILDSSLLYIRRQELRELANQSAHVNLILSRLRSVLPPTRTTWNDAHAQLRGRFDLARQLLPTVEEETSTTTLEDSLFALLSAGHLSAALTQVFGQPLTEVQVKKLGKSVDGALVILLQALLTQVIPCVELLLFRLSELLALSKCADRFAAIGFVEQPVVAAVQAARLLLLRAEALLEETHLIKVKYHDLFDFLLNGSLKANGSPVRTEQLLSDTAINNVAAMLSTSLNDDPLASAFGESASSMVVLLRDAERLCNAALGNPSLIISRSITLVNACPLLQTPPRTLPPLFSFRQVQLGNQTLQLLAFTKPRQAQETVADVWLLAYSFKTPISAAHLVPEGGVTSVTIYDNETIAVFRAGDQAKLSLFPFDVNALVALPNDSKPITERAVATISLQPVKQRELTLPAPANILAVVAPPRGLGALACEQRVLLFDFALPPDEGEDEQDE